MHSTALYSLRILLRPISLCGSPKRINSTNPSSCSFSAFTDAQTLFAHRQYSMYHVPCSDILAGPLVSSYLFFRERLYPRKQIQILCVGNGLKRRAIVAVSQHQNRDILSVYRFCIFPKQRISNQAHGAFRRETTNKTSCKTNKAASRRALSSSA